MSAEYSTGPQQHRRRKKLDGEVVLIPERLNAIRTEAQARTAGSGVGVTM